MRSSSIRWMILGLIILLFAGCFLWYQHSKMAIATENALVDPNEILSGGPPKDGIPALLKPRFIAPGQARYLKSSDPVVGVTINGQSRAYPIKILNWHEAVNDTLGGEPIVVTFCPLTQSALVFERKIAGKTHTFGISGKLYKSNVLLYDHQTDSLWSQLKEKAITGPMSGATLKQLPSVQISWKNWQRKQAATEVLSDDTGYNRDYSVDPYAGYYRLGSLMFPVGEVRTDLSAKTLVVGIQTQGVSKAYPVELFKTSDKLRRDHIKGREIHFELSQENEVISVKDQQGRLIPHIFSYWFAWQAFHPQTELYSPVAADS
ncbi:DUF3179 domain-containing protein [Dongshaea marina]|uniref:DUF3179 domain-containing protein n=1 Tax=Dongshaea marina TaxID=2047966 RepID=UPI000D3E26DF|nr:DUF3179 domain-containing protein [Dongshaea marina]